MLEMHHKNGSIYSINDIGKLEKHQHKGRLKTSFCIFHGFLKLSTVIN